MRFKSTHLIKLMVFSVILPVTGHSALLQQRAPTVKKKVNTHSFFIKTNPEVHFMDLSKIAFGSYGASAIPLSNPSSFDFNGFGAGGGLNLDIGWCKAISFKFKGAMTHVLGETNSSFGQVIRATTLDSLAQTSIFFPLNSSSHLLLNFGWDYFWTELKGQISTTGSSRTTGILRLNGPFGGVGLSTQLTSEFSFDAGLSYYAPRGRALLLTSSPSLLTPVLFWSKQYFRLSRSGFGCYLCAGWKISQSWRLSTQIQGKSFYVASKTPGTTGQSFLSIGFMNYSLAAAYTF